MLSEGRSPAAIRKAEGRKGPDVGGQSMYRRWGKGSMPRGVLMVWPMWRKKLRGQRAIPGPNLLGPDEKGPQVLRQPRPAYANLQDVGGQWPVNGPMASLVDLTVEKVGVTRVEKPSGFDPRRAGSPPGGQLVERFSAGFRPQVRGCRPVGPSQAFMRWAEVRPIRWVKANLLAKLRTTAGGRRRAKKSSQGICRSGDRYTLLKRYRIGGDVGGGAENAGRVGAGGTVQKVGAKAW